MPDSIAVRVARGAALLDERKPGWWQRIDLNALDQLSPCGCVLGQTFHLEDDPLEDGYWLGLNALDIPARPVSAPERFGFAAASGRIGDYRLLDDEWTRLIEARRAGAS